MSMRYYISFVGAWIVPLIILVVGIVSAVMIREKFKSGDLSFDSQVVQMEIEEKQEEVKALKQSLESLERKLELQQEYEAQARQLAEIATEAEYLRDTKLVVESRLSSLEKGLRQTMGMFEEYKQRYRDQVRSEAAGTKMDQLETIGGHIYHEVKIKSVGALGMDVTHESGSARIPFKELPLEMQKHFQFDEAEAEAQKKLEAEMRRKRERVLAELSHGQKVTGSVQVAGEATAMSEAEFKRAEEQLEQAIEAIEDRLHAARANLLAEQKKTVSRAPIYQTEIKELSAALRENEARLRKLRSMR